MGEREKGQQALSDVHRYDSTGIAVMNEGNCDQVWRSGGACAVPQAVCEAQSVSIAPILTNYHELHTTQKQYATTRALVIAQTREAALCVFEEPLNATSVPHGLTAPKYSDEALMAQIRQHVSLLTNAALRSCVTEDLGCVAAWPVLHCRWFLMLKAAFLILQWRCRTNHPAVQFALLRVLLTFAHFLV